MVRALVFQQCGLDSFPHSTSYVGGVYRFPTRIWETIFPSRPVSPLAGNPKFDFIYWDLDWLVVSSMTTATAGLNTLRLKWSDKYYKATLKFTLIFLQITDEDLGCFNDKTAQRAFPTLVKNLRPEINWQYLERTIEKCALLSKQQNFKVKDAKTVIWLFFLPFVFYVFSVCLQHENLWSISYLSSKCSPHPR